MSIVGNQLYHAHYCPFCGKQNDIQEATQRLTKWIMIGTIVAAIGAIIAAIF